MRPQIFLSLLLLFNGLAFGQGSTSYSGYIDLYYMAHLSDNSLINLPYRMFDLTLQHKNENLDIYADLAMEYTPNATHTSMHVKVLLDSACQPLCTRGGGA